MGAWIETKEEPYLGLGGQVAPHVGAWIETSKLLGNQSQLTVAPHVGAWIETELNPINDSFHDGRAPRGRVD